MVLDGKSSQEYLVNAVATIRVDWSNYSGAIDVKMNGSVFDEKSSFKRTCCFFWTLSSSSKCSQFIFFCVGITLVGVHLNCLNWVHFLILVAGPPVTLIDCMVFVLPFLNVIRMFMSTVSFLAQLGYGIICLQNLFLWPMIQIASNLELIHTLSLGSF